MGSEGFAVDASMIKAGADRQRGVPGSEWQAPEAANQVMHEYLALLDDAACGAAAQQRRCGEARLPRRPGRTLDGSERQDRLLSTLKRAVIVVPLFMPVA
jgi:hypothetical protein